jgi:hypothetical protein
MAGASFAITFDNFEGTYCRHTKRMSEVGSSCANGISGADAGENRHRGPV